MIFPHKEGRAPHPAITLDTYSHAIPANPEEAAALIAGPVFSGE